MPRFIHLSHFFWFKQCKQSNGLYSEKNLLKEFLMMIRGESGKRTGHLIFVHDLRTNYLQDTLI